ncbi:MAG: glycosyl hydrolase family 28 protein [Armatimonadota bacterium]|nr:glycosyl hydrolase family 28 protein [Armatimonadota bacterium]
MPLPTSPLPVGPRVFDVTRYGALGDGHTVDTLALRKAIAACGAAGGGTVYLPPGRFLTGSLQLPGNTLLYLEAGAVLLGSREIKDYDPRHLVWAKGVQNVGIAGRGVIDGQGDAFWDPIPPAEPGKRPPWPRPRARCDTLLDFEECEGVRIQDVTIRNAPGWTLHPFFCDGVFLRGITIRNHLQGPNTDGIDVNACRNVFISDCDISTGDDAIVLKNTGRGGRKRLSRNIVVTNCILNTLCNGFKIGTETLEGFEDVVFGNSIITNEVRGLQAISGVAIEMVDGAHLARVSVSNLTMMNVRAPLFIRLGNRGRGQAVPTPGTLRHISLSNITATGAEVTSSITGLPGHPVENVSLTNIHLTTRGGGEAALARREVPERPDAYPEATMFGDLPAYGLYCHHVSGLRLSQVEVNWEEPDLRPALVCDDVNRLHVENFSAMQAAGVEPVVRLVNVEEAFLRGCRSPRTAGCFLHVEGERARRIALGGNDLSAAAQPVRLGAGAARDALYTPGDAPAPDARTGP